MITSDKMNAINMLQNLYIGQYILLSYPTQPPIWEEAGKVWEGRNTNETQQVYTDSGFDVIVVIDVIIILVFGLSDGDPFLIVLSNWTFLESGPFLIIGGLILMVGGFPSLSMATRRKWDKELEKETITHSYIPMCLALFLILFSIIISLFA